MKMNNGAVQVAADLIAIQECSGSSEERIDLMIWEAAAIMTVVAVAS